MRYYWRNNRYKEKPPFFSAPYDLLTSFFLCQTVFLQAFLTSIEYVGLGDFWDDKWRSLVQLRLHWQKWCHHFSPGINKEGLSQTFTLVSWANVLLESTEYVWYVRANKNIKQLAFFCVRQTSTLLSSCLGQMFCLNQLNMCCMWKQTKVLTS